ncbi:MAG: amidohydrolase [Bacteroidia bacterium]|nr:amidohydrolase [Bacteroidia bacterium]MDW8134617.1 amidohydrolase [Bacteroidia bacterium]
MEGWLSEAQVLLPHLVYWRRHLHQYPELSFEERETQHFILTELSKLSDIRLKKAAGTGVIADLVTDPQGPWVALRADMDALPLEETGDRSYRSKRPGVMHACGHDAHTAILLGVAYLLWKHQEKWRGGVRLIFQPAEEKAPGGASLMIQEGVLQEVPIKAIWGLHVTPQLPVGRVGLRAGPFMAASDEIHINLRSCGGHGAYPHLAPDPIVVGAYMISQMQAIVSRAADPRNPTVLTFGTFQAGSAPNIIPTEAYIAGTLRTFEETWREKAKTLIYAIASHTAQTWGIEASIEFSPGYPVLVNHPSLTQWTRKHLEALLGEGAVEELPLWMSSEDFAFYGQQVPACFIRLGTAGESEDTKRPVHTNAFDIDERALAFGVAILTHIALNFLNEA